MFFSQAKAKLLQGEELEESFVIDIVLEKLNSPEIKHYGTYMHVCVGIVPCRLPSVSVHDL